MGYLRISSGIAKLGLITVLLPVTVLCGECVLTQEDTIICSYLSLRELPLAFGRLDNTNRSLDLLILQNCFWGEDAGLFNHTTARRLILNNTELVGVNNPFWGTEQSLTSLVIHGSRFFRDRDFSKLEILTRLEELEITNSLLYSIAWAQTSYLPSSLRTVRFAQNKIRVLGEEAFVDLPIVNLDLSENFIRKLPKKGFSNTLKTLVLSHNSLDSPPTELLASLPHLELLDLTYNGLISMEFTTLENFDYNVTVDLHGNPLDCCRLMWILDSPPPFHFRGRCKNPREHHGKDITILDHADFNKCNEVYCSRRGAPGQVPEM